MPHRRHFLLGAAALAALPAQAQPVKITLGTTFNGHARTLPPLTVSVRTSPPQQ